MVDIGEVIKKRRLKLNMSRQEFEDFVGISKCSIANYEREKVCPSFDTVQIIAEKLDMTLDEFLDISDVEEWETRKEYALYKGEEILAMGTAKEIAEKLGIKTSSVHMYHTNWYRKKTGENGRRLVEITDED